MTAIVMPIAPKEGEGICTAAALLVTPDGRYLMQLRDDKAGISFPGFFSFFGGAIEPGEEPETGLRRELHEELEMEADDISYFSKFVFDAIYADGSIRQRYYLQVPIDAGVIESLVLHEGADMQLMTADDIAAESFRFVPYDFAIIRMHMLLRERGNLT